MCMTTRGLKIAGDISLAPSVSAQIFEAETARLNLI